MTQKQLQLTQRERLNNSAGFSLVEVLLSIVIFAMLVGTFISSLIYSQESERLAGDRARATFLAQEGMEAIRNIRDENFSNLTNGDHGLAVSGNVWTFSGTSDTTDIFTRAINISDIDVNTKLITSNVTWKQNEQRDGLVTLTSRLTNWQKIRLTEAEQFMVDVSGSDIDPTDTSHVIGLTIENISTYTDITLDQIQVSWSGNGRISSISLGGLVVWTGNDISGSTLDITDFILAQGAGSYDIDYLDFNRDFSGREITLNFIMSDGSTKQTIFTPGTPPDETPPSDISNLSTSNPSQNSVNLSWTAPGDDGNSGTASSYDIRYSTVSIDDSNWGSATQISGEPNPSSAGSSESMTISGLSSSTTYYFAIKTSDEVPNISGLSNVASATTLPPPPPPQANYLVVNTATAGLSANSRDVINITLQNSGATNITIVSMIVSWTGVNSNRRLRNIAISGVDVWTGNANTGATEDITDTTLVSGASASPLSYLRFSNTITNIVLSLTFNMSDGSSKTVSGIGPL